MSRRDDFATDPTVTPVPGLDATLPSIDPDVPADDLDALPTVDPDVYVREGDLARGGMGRIIKARDQRLGRTVAIKETLGQTPAQRARFEREIRLTARLEHPSIVALHEAGRWPDGEQFFAMRLVPGRSLDVVIAERKTLGERLALLPHVIAAAHALAYAHDERVIHRDLKPANILVGDFGETVVIDWGLAKDLSAADERDEASDSPYRKGASELETVDGSVMGTPAYMPPEQAAGEKVDERSDVYALGAILYSVLTGAAPYGGKSIDEILVNVLSGPPEPVTQRAPGVPQDLVTIVDKAMAAEPEDRYPTAKQLVADLERFQTGQLVGAHRYSSRELFVRWLRKHRLTVSIAAALGVVLVVAGAWAVRRDARARAVAERASTDAITRRDAAEGLVDYVVFQLRDRLEQVGRLDILAATSDRVLGYYAEIAGLGDTDAKATSRHAAAITVLGDVATSRGDVAGARTLYEQSLALHEANRAREPDAPLYQRNVAIVLDKLGLLEQGAGRTDEALAHLRTSLELREALARRFPDKREARTDLAAGHDHLAMLLFETLHRLDDAETHFQASFQLSEALLAETPDDADALTDVARAHENLGDLSTRRDQLDAAVQHYRTSIELRRRARAIRPDDTELQTYLAVALDRAGIGLMMQGAIDDAAVVRSEALALWRALVALEPDDLENQREIGSLLTFFGDVAAARGDVDAAAKHYAESIDVMARLVARAPDNVMWMSDHSVGYQQLGNLELARGRLDAAAAAYARNLEISEDIQAADSQNPRYVWGLGVAHEKVGDLARARGDHAAAAAAYRTEVEWLRKAAALAPQDDQYLSDLAWAMANASDSEIAAGAKDAARALLDETLTIRTAITTRHPERDDWQIDLADSHDRLAAILGDKSDEARGHLDEAIALLEALAKKGPLPPEIEPGLASLRQRRLR